MTDPTPAEVIAFLNGEGPINGRWFGDEPPKADGRRRTFWWRKYLPILTQPPAADAGEVRTYRDGVEEAAFLADRRAESCRGFGTPDGRHRAREARLLAAAIRKLGS